MRVAILIVLLAALVASCTTGPTTGQSEVAQVGVAGGVVGRGGGPARVSVPPGAASDGTTVRIAVASSPPPPSADAVATALRPPVEIAPSAPLPGAEVRLPFDPLTELPEADGNRATIANAYIAVYNEDIGAWVPLETRFEDGELVATAPHFSRFGTFVVDPAKAAWSAGKTGVQAAWDAGGDLAGAAWNTGGDVLSGAGTAAGAVKEFLNPKKAEIEKFCDPETDGWDLRTPMEEIDGCVQAAANGDLFVWIENGLRLMYDARPPQAFDIGLNDQDGYTALVPYLARRMNLHLGLALVPARGLVKVRIPAATASRLSRSGSSFTVAMEPEQLGLAVQAVFAALAWLPGRKYVEQTVVRLSERGAFVELTERGLTGVAYLREVMVIVMRELSVEKPDVLRNAGLINDGVNCVAGTYSNGPPESTDVDEITKFALGTAKRCASTAVEGLKENVGDVLGVVAAFPDTLDALAAVADGVKVADPFSGHVAGQFDLRFTRAADAPGVAAPQPPGGTDIYALAKAVDTAGAGAMTYDEIQWFWAPDAAQKCAEDRVTPNGAWCTDYYYRNVNDRLRTAAIDPAAIITLAPNGTVPESATLAQLAAQVSRGLEFPCVLHIDGGTVTRIDQIFTP